MNLPLMPKATAIWLVENTALTFQQIADFCGLHFLEIESIANGDFDSKMSGLDPIVSSQLTLEEINRCEKDPSTKLQLKDCHHLELRAISRKYTPKAKRQDKPDAIAWILKYYPDISEHDICNLIGTTKMTIRAIKNKTHRNISTINPRSPTSLGLCTETDLDFIVSKLSRS
jgi:hypothetical protein